MSESHDHRYSILQKKKKDPISFVVPFLTTPKRNKLLPNLNILVEHVS